MAKNRYIPVDEHFNKHVVFHSNGLTADIMYTGVAQWSKNGKQIQLYDVISESLIKAVTKNLAFAPLSLSLIADIMSATSPTLIKDKNYGFELHITGYHNEIPFPWISVISTFRKSAPWNNVGELQWEYDYQGVKIFIKAADKPDIVIGGMDSGITINEKKALMKAIHNGADAFNLANLSSCIIENASKRTSAIGARSVSILMPRSGYLDSNLWDKKKNTIVAFMPRMVFPNGTVFGPSEFPVEMSLITDGQLPKHSLFFKSIVYSQYKRRMRQHIFKHKKGRLIPGIMGLLQLSLFGKVAAGYTDFGLGHES